MHTNGQRVRCRSALACYAHIAHAFNPSQNISYRETRFVFYFVNSSLFFSERNIIVDSLLFSLLGNHLLLVQASSNS